MAATDETTLNEQHLRLRCLELVLGGPVPKSGLKPDAAVQQAATLFKFVKG